MENNYSKSVAYFSMEIAIDQTMKTYSGGLGFLAGSHMRSAYELKQNLVGVTILWKDGYYDQVRGENFHMEVKYIQKYYSFLKDTGIVVNVPIHGHNVKVRAYYLEPEIFNTAPIYFLTTDIEENDYLSKTITHRLYEANQTTRIAQEIVLGIGGIKVLEKIKEIDIYHMNEAHPLPLAFHLYGRYKNIEKVRSHLVFTTHTPEKAGNSTYSYDLAYKMGYLDELSIAEVQGLLGDSGPTLECTAAALKMCKIANGVSQMHAVVAQDMWKHIVPKEHIIGITNAQNQNYWQDSWIRSAIENDDEDLLVYRKRELKKELFKEVALQEGDLFKPDVLTIVWARRFAGYKRPDLVVKSMYDFLDLLEDSKYPVQMIWAGKPHPNDTKGIELFNSLIDVTYSRDNCAVLVGYELDLSAKLKKGADIWLNTPKITREASGTSGMTASMNGAINCSIPDGWIPEYAKDGENCFLIPSSISMVDHQTQDEADYENMMKVIKETIIPMYYEQPEKWIKIMKNSIKDVCPQFESGRMAHEYYTRMYNI